MTHRRAQMGGREFRTLVAPGLEMRARDNGPTASSGYASVTGVPYEMRDWWGDPYTEVVDVGAFEGVLSRQPDTRLLVNHDGIPLARTTSGTLTLAEHTTGPTTGLFHEAELDGASQLVVGIRSAITRRDLTEMSFMFRARGEWSPDYTQRNIREVTELYDVSFVTFPANPGTSVQLHSASRLASVDDLDEADLRAAHARLGTRLADIGRTEPRGRPLGLYRRRLTLAGATTTKESRA